MMPLRDHRLTWEQRKTLHERLLARAAELRADLARELHARDAETLGLPDPREATDDDAVSGLEADIGLAEAQRDSAELREIDDALHRLDTAAYGACVGCGAPIAWDRLLARPQVQRCTRCQAAFERAESAPARL